MTVHRMHYPFIHTIVETMQMVVINCLMQFTWRDKASSFIFMQIFETQLLSIPSFYTVFKNSAKRN